MARVVWYFSECEDDNVDDDNDDVDVDLEADADHDVDVDLDIDVDVDGDDADDNGQWLWCSLSLYQHIVQEGLQVTDDDSPIDCLRILEKVHMNMITCCLIYNYIHGHINNGYDYKYDDLI